MKRIVSTILSLSALSLATSALASEKYEKISCVNRPGAALALKIEAKTISISKQNEGAMWGVTATATGEFAGEQTTWIGRKDAIDVDAAYKPKKYKNHSRFDLSKLVDTRDFGRYLPSDSCVLNFLVPNDVNSRETVEAPVVINCDQGGGTQTLDCTLSAR